MHAQAEREDAGRDHEGRDEDLGQRGRVPDGVELALRRTRGNMKAAAESLEIDRSTLYEKVRRYGIPRAAEGD